MTNKAKLALIAAVAGGECCIARACSGRRSSRSPEWAPCICDGAAARSPDARSICDGAARAIGFSIPTARQLRVVAELSATTNY